jgi:hypothetical protein
MANAPSALSLEWATDGPSSTPAFRMLGSRLSQLAFNFATRDGALTYQAQGMGIPVAAGSATTVLTPTATDQLAGWNVSATFGSQTLETALDGQITLARTLIPVHGALSTAGIQAPRVIRSGQLKVTGRLSFEFAGTVAYNNYLAAKNDAALTIVFTQGSYNLTFIMTKLGWREGSIDVADNIYTVPIQFNALHNSTDAGPINITFLNGVAVGY